MNRELKKTLKAWRKKLRIPQKQAADLLGVNVRTYQGWEEGRGGNDSLKLSEVQRRMALAKERVA